MGSPRVMTSLATAALVAGGCGQRAGEESRRAAAGAAEAEAEPEEDELATPRGEVTGPEVVFRPIGAPEARVSVEVARTERQIELGLMYRSHLPPDAGMLFLFERPKVQVFWMKNTIVPLDMIFVSPEMVVVGVVENAAPMTTARRLVPGVASQFVVEVNGGWARTHRVAAGVPVEFVRVAPAGAVDGG